MKNAARNFGLLVYFGTLLASCSPSRQLLNPASPQVFTGKDYIVIHNTVYRTLVMQIDTIACKILYQNSDGPGGQRIPVSESAA